MRKRPSQRRLVPLSVKWYHDILKQYINRYFFLSMSTYPISWYPDVHRIFAGCPQKSAGLTAVGHLASFRWNGTGFGNVTGYGNGAPRPVNHKKRTIRFGETKIKLVWKYILKNSFHEIHSWSQRRGQPRSRWVGRPCWLSSSRSQGALHMKSISLAVFCFQKSNASQNWYFRLKLFIFARIEVHYLKLCIFGTSPWINVENRKIVPFRQICWYFLFFAKD